MNEFPTITKAVLKALEERFPMKDFGQTDDGLLYLVMEFIHGQTLREYCGGRALSAKRANTGWTCAAIPFDRALSPGSTIACCHPCLTPRKPLMPVHVRPASLACPALLHCDCPCPAQPCWATPNPIPTASAW